MPSRLQDIIARLRDRKLRITPQRLAVLKILLASTAHPSAEQVFAEVRKDFPAISLATIYKTAALLKEMGEMSELALRDGSCRFDGNRPYPHPHLVCSGCKTILDLDDVPTESLAEEIGRRTGYRILNHRLDFFGLCPACQELRQH